MKTQIVRYFAHTCMLRLVFKFEFMQLIQDLWFIWLFIGRSFHFIDDPFLLDHCSLVSHSCCLIVARGYAHNTILINLWLWRIRKMGLFRCECLWIDSIILKITKMQIKAASFFPRPNYSVSWCALSKCL